jgi:hypothetical protein
VFDILERDRRLWLVKSVSGRVAARVVEEISLKRLTEAAGTTPASLENAAVEEVLTALKEWI